ncbi:hypothetical protein DFH09DRAFT_1294202 [Mycena vulgaris]|nr:hypothetical protein DFH09DRAFT_1294202 [Mycena vulgaris]
MQLDLLLSSLDLVLARRLSQCLAKYGCMAISSSTFTSTLREICALVAAILRAHRHCDIVDGTITPVACGNLAKQHYERRSNYGSRALAAANPESLGRMIEFQTSAMDSDDGDIVVLRRSNLDMDATSAGLPLAESDWVLSPVIISGMLAECTDDDGDSVPDLV